MSNNKELMILNQMIPSEQEFKTMQTMARLAAASGLYVSSSGTEAKILMILFSARELGVPLMQALNGGIWNIQGKIEISARLMNSMIRRAGHNINITHCDEKCCIIEGKRADNGDTFTAKFTMEDAKRAGLIRNNRDGSAGMWFKYSEDMLYARALSRLARRLFPDVIGTAYVEGEIQDAKYEVIEPVKEDFEENQEEVDAKLREYLSEFNEDKIAMMTCYLIKYKNHWKKSIDQVLRDYEDREKFLTEFAKWESKQK